MAIEMTSNAPEALPKKGFWPELTVKFIAIAVSFVAAVFFFGLITHEVIVEKDEVFDNRVFRFFDNNVSDGFVSVMRFFTFFGSSTFLIPAYLLLVLFYIYRKQRRRAINIMIIGVSSTALMFGLKEVFKRNRPDIPIVKTIKTFSFPSGHSLSAFIFCSVLIYLIWHSKLATATKWVLTVLLLLFAITIGISRIVLKVHFATDVIAGFCLGFAWVIPTFWLLRKIEKNKAIHQV